MSELVTVFKIFILSLIILAVMQMKWNGVTMESQALVTLHTSHVGETIEQVSMGAAKAIHNGVAWTKSTADSLWSKVSPKNSTAPAEQKASR